MKTGATNKKIRELITMVTNGTLIPRPEFQRRLVWTRDDKNNFLDTIVRGYPFPEIYFADGEVNTETGEGTQLLVDGQQRVSTIFQYFHGDNDLKLTIVRPYKDLTEDEKKAFLQYEVPVRDLGSISKEEIIEVFRRINATKYSLRDIEVNNAIFDGACKVFAQNLAEHSFFETHSVFNASDYKRMGDLRFVLSLISGILNGYSNRDDSLESLLSRYNDDFPKANEVNDRLEKVFSFLDECGFSPKSRIWKKADLYTAILEIDQRMNVEGQGLSPSETISTLETFFDNIDSKEDAVSQLYYRSALQASNDKGSRVKRGLIIGGLLRGEPMDTIIENIRIYL